MRLTFDEAVRRLERRGRVSPAGDRSVRAQCPAHDGERESLSVREIDGRLAVKCFSKECSTEQIIAAIELIGTKPLSARQMRVIKARVRPERPEGSYEQHFELKGLEGDVVATHVRVNDKDGNKLDVYWKGGLGGRRPTSLPLFGSDVLKLALDEGYDGPVYLMEGEKDTLAMWERGYMAVGTVTGSGSIPDDAVLRVLVGLDVKLCPDNDPGGQRHMERIAARLEYLNNQEEETNGD